MTANYERLNNLQYEFTPNGTPIASLVNGNTVTAASRTIQRAETEEESTAYRWIVSVESSDREPGLVSVGLATGTIDQVQAGSLPGAAGQAAAAGATWQLNQNLEPFANKSTVGPRFQPSRCRTSFGRATGWDINAGIRFESYGYALGDVSSPEQAFWFDQINATACVDPNGLKQVPATDFTGGASRYGGVPQSLLDYYTTPAGQACAIDPLTHHQLYHPGRAAFRN